MIEMEEACLTSVVRACSCAFVAVKIDTMAHVALLPRFSLPDFSSTRGPEARTRRSQCPCATQRERAQLHSGPRLASRG